MGMTKRNCTSITKLGRMPISRKLEIKSLTNILRSVQVQTWQHKGLIACQSTRQYSQTAYRFGDYVIKYSLVPSGETQKKLAEEMVKPDSHSDHILSDWLKEFYDKHDAEYLFQVQLLENLEEQPVEYAGTKWDEEKYPWQTVAKVVIPKQDSFIPMRKAFWEDHMRLDPWHGLKSLQPLGSPNRLRRGVYPVSSKLRREVNGRRQIDLSSIDQIPDGGFIDL